MIIHVGFDLDGVCRNFDEQFARYAKERYDITVTEEDMAEYGYASVLDTNGRRIIKDVFTDPGIGRFIFEDAPPITNAFTGYSLFVQHSGFEQYIVSTQKREYEQFSNNWIRNNRFTENAAVFYERNKLNAPVQVLIDDKPENVEKYIKNGRDAILITTPKTKNYQSNLPVPQVTDLIEAYQYAIDKYSKYL